METTGEVTASCGYPLYWQDSTRTLYLGDCRQVLPAMPGNSVSNTVRDNSYLIGNQFAKGNKPNRTSFKRGGIPWNKGISVHLSPRTEFKKGMPSLKKMELGTIVQRRHKGDGLRNWIKVGGPNKWQEYTKYVWIQEFGRILRGDIIHHINGDRLDDRITNLIALPRKDHPIFHSRWGLHPFSEYQLSYYIGRYSPKWYLCRQMLREQDISEPYLKLSIQRNKQGVL